MPRTGDYLFKRKGSQNWYVRIQYPPSLAKAEGKKKREISLGTPDREEAWIKASEYITEHKRILFSIKQIARVHKVAHKGPKRFEPGKIHPLPDGGYVVATEDKLTYYNSSMKEQRQELNSETIRIPIQPTAQEIREIMPYVVSRKNPDDDIIEHWIRHRGISKHIADEARRAWTDFKELTVNKPLSKCTRKDGIALANYYLSKNNNSSTVEKKVGHLRAAYNLHIIDLPAQTNPFHKVTPNRDDSLRRVPLDDNDMSLVRSRLGELRGEDQLLWKVLATTGMRLDEAFQIQDEFCEEGVRCVSIGTKTASSKRRIPLPTSLLGDLPPIIDHPLFEGKSEVAGKRLIYFLKRLGISYKSSAATGNKGKVVHSLRHRAKDRLRRAKCPLDIQYEILGHEILTVAAGYGRGSPMKDVLQQIDTIGY